ncbi:uncharacterized protein DUF222 [Brevibacterium sanguinis]|uniref:Uncharacterized protein DUF222 n=2 Tax=Brevibacterium TaxID=1696 RepID=A0A366IGV4_9MICO|nr:MULTISPECIES: HNH endonuclease signature motif containing protein [Brevibacterium]RBP63917.1 uncharacterized protein DUF222 [Brevibacterium sanguinis]RBP70808.1 uncharacterized protein DUF222 [Brevibacterium celere]
MDLTDHPLGDRFAALPAVPGDDDQAPVAESGETSRGSHVVQTGVTAPSAAVDDSHAASAAESPELPAASSSEPRAASSSEPLAVDEAGIPGPDSGGSRERRATATAVTTAAGEAVAPADDRPSSASSHPLFSAESWSDLERFAPELTASIERLESLKDGLRTFERLMGPDEAVLVIDGIETATRVLEGLSAVALSVFERCGTPADLGAKSTKDLVRDRLQLTGAEAARRTELAKNLGNRVTESGQSIEPLCPVVADGLHTGVLSAGQAAVIGECLQKVPAKAGPDVRAEVERILVEHAPRVRVMDLRVIFKRLLDEIDPDGEEPTEPDDRSTYCVKLRARRNGSWDLSGRLDAITGGVLHGLLTSRIQSSTDGTNGAAPATAEAGTEGNRTAGAIAGSGGPTHDDGSGGSDRDTDSTNRAVEPSHGDDASGNPDLPGQEMLEIFDAVLSGDRSDAPMVSRTTDEGAAGVGIREDGSLVDLCEEQGSVRAHIYERFATLVSRIDMTRVAAGAPYALVVTAKADDLAERKGTGTTSIETPVPIEELVRGGLNGAVFFHLMSEHAKTVQVTTEKRFANAKQIAVLTARDQGCVFPGCDTPPGWCDVHHCVPWSEGGKTNVNNMMLVCGAHHRLLDRTDWETVMLRDGRPAWVPPAAIDPARKPILHARFIAREIIETLFD